MPDQPRDELTEYLHFGLSRFPHWFGFRPERRTATLRPLRIYRRGEAWKFRVIGEKDVARRSLGESNLEGRDYWDVSRFPK